MAPLLRFLPADDERIRATVLAIADELTVDGLVLRYKVEETDDGFSGDEGTFTICSFWLVSELSEIGEHERARALCAKLLSFARPLELYAEEIDPTTGAPPGQLPAGLHPPRSHQRRPSRHPGRRGAPLLRRGVLSAFPTVRMTAVVVSAETKVSGRERFSDGFRV
ncbi:MAG: glycoside hydrolase family 15 protein [Lapillicoccus sp.]